MFCTCSPIEVFVCYFFVPQQKMAIEAEKNKVLNKATADVLKLDVKLAKLDRRSSLASTSSHQTLADAEEKPKAKRSKPEPGKVRVVPSR